MGGGGGGTEAIERRLKISLVRLMAPMDEMALIRDAGTT